MALLFAIITAYLIGSIPTGIWMGRAFLDVDIRDHGSGNMGATNAFRVLGKFLGTTVLFIDILKGLAPVAILPALFGIKSGSNAAELIIGASAIFGHVFSVFANFRGGKGVATTLGVFLAIAPAEMIVILVTGITIIFLTGYVSAASVTGAVMLPLMLYINDRPALVLFVSLVASLMVIFRHRGNINRLLAGNERRIYDRTPTAGDENQPIPLTRGSSTPGSPE